METGNQFNPINKPIVTGTPLPDPHPSPKATQQKAIQEKATQKKTTPRAKPAASKAAADKMADNSSEIASAEGIGMSKTDIDFLVVCVQNATGGTLVVDQAKVASATGMTNLKSVANKVALFKKKYGLPLATSTRGASSAGASSTSPAVPKTPNKNKVAKTNGSTKKATPKSKSKEVKSEEKVEEDAEMNDDQDAVSGAEEATVSPSLSFHERMSTPDLEIACFGKPDTDDEVD